MTSFVFAAILFAFAVFSFDIAVRALFNNSNNEKLFLRMSLIAVGSCLLCIGRGLMLVITAEHLLAIFWIMAVSGYIIFQLASQGIMLAIGCRRKAVFKGIVIFEVIVDAILLLLLIAQYSVTAGYAGVYLSKIYSVIIILSVLVSILISISMMCDAGKKNLVMGRLFLLLDIIIFISIIAELVPVDISNIPFSALVMHLSLCVICIAIYKLDRNLIGGDNMSRYIYSSLKSPILVFDENERIIKANNAAMQLFAIDNLELFNRRNFWGDVVKLNTNADIKEEAGTIIAEADYTNGYRKLKLRIHMDKLYDEFNDYIGYIAMIEDVTLISGYMQELELAKNEADKLSAVKSQFLANISHEVRTPMNSILGFSELALKMDCDSNIKEFFGDIHKSAENLLAIINDVLDIVRIDAGDMELTEEEIPSEKLFKHITQRILPRIEAKKLEFNFDLDSDFPKEIYGDRVKITRIIYSLLINAVKYTDKGFVRLKVSFVPVVGMNEGKAIFIIKDSGQGVREEDKDQVFAKFQPVDVNNADNTDGTGLDLSISKSYTDLLGGKISLESTYGEGTTMTVELPLKVIDSSPVREANTSAVKEHKAVPINELHILAVDDSDTNLKVLRLNMKKRFGVDIKTASSGADAIELCRFNDFDLVFMDHMMPKMDGVEAMKFIRMLERGYEGGGKRKIVVLTANVIPDSKEMLLNEGFDGFIGKPIDYQELEECVGRLFFR